LICVRKGDFQTKVNDACGERHDQRQPLDPRTEPSAAFGLRLSADTIASQVGLISLAAERAQNRDT